VREIAARRINSSLCHNSHRKAAIQSERLLPFLNLSNTVRGKETCVDGHQLEQIYLPIKTEKCPRTAPGIEPETSRLVAQCFHQLRHRLQLFHCTKRKNA
jgi:hypothetical protein